MKRALGLLTALLLAACGPARAGDAPPPGSAATATSWPALAASDVRQRIVRRLASPDLAALTAIAPADADADAPLAAALLAAGALERRGGAYAFSAAGRRASVDCGNAREPELRCFALTSARLVHVLGTVRRPVTFSGGGEDETFFRFRAAPGTPLARRLADAGVLACATGAGPAATPWRGAATLARGVIVTTTRPGLALPDLVETACPRVRARAASGLAALLRDGPP